MPDDAAAATAAPASPARTRAPGRPGPLARAALPVVWGVLPLLAGPALAAAVADADRGVQLVVSWGAWAGWLVGLVAALVPSTASLTVVRLVVPAALAASAAAAVAGAGAVVSTVAVGASTVATVVALAAPTADVHVDGSSYGDEQRFVLRTPAALLLGPVEAGWAVTVAGFVVGPVLLASGAWVVGAVVTVLGVAVAIAGVRALHQLSRRWLVFVPAGVVVHDTFVMVDALLVPRRLLAAFGPAPGDTAALDLTAGARGLALELGFAQPLELALRPRRRDATAETIDAPAVLVSAARPGAVLRAAAARRLA